jgi:hypothetical protein
MARAVADKKEKKTEQVNLTDYERLSVGVDVGTSHCEVVCFGKNSDDLDEEKYHFSDKPCCIRCMSSLIMFAKDNESSINFLLRFQERHSMAVQEEYLSGKDIPFIFHDQMEDLVKAKKVSEEELDILRRSTHVEYPVKTKRAEDAYTDMERAVIRLNIERAIAPFANSEVPMDISVSKPCEVGADYDSILREVVAKIANLNSTFDNRFFTRSEAVFTGHYLMNMLDGSPGAVAVCDLGAGTGDVYIFDQDDSETKAMRTFKNAGNYMTHQLMRNLKEFSNVDISERDANQLKETSGYISGYNIPTVVKKVIVDLYIDGKPRKVRAGKSLDAAARPIAHTAVETIVEVFKAYDGFHPRTIALTGFQGQMEGMDKAIEEGLEMEGYSVTVKNLKAFGEKNPRNVVGKGAEHYSRGLKNQNWTSL